MHSTRHPGFAVAVLVGVLVTGLLGASAARAAALVLYDDQLQNQFEDWSWAQHDLAQTSVVHSGARAISMVPANWQGLYLHRGGGVDVEQNGTLDFWIHGGATGGQQLRFFLYSGNQPLANAELEGFIQGGAVPAGHWAHAEIPFSALGVTSGIIDGIIFQADAASTQPTVYLDDLVFLDTAGPPQPIQVTVDPDADRHAINPLVYGVNFGSSGEFGATPYPLRRWGGNSVSRYSWTKDATNHASDWFYINLPEGDGDSTHLPDGSSADLWVDATRAASAEAIITVPTIGWVARDREKRWGFSVAKYGPQQETECTASGWPTWCEPDAGNGVRPDSSLITGNDPHDTSVEVGPSYVAAWIQHLVAREGSAPEGGVAFYALDNEPMLWNSTHRDVHPAPGTLDELWSYTQAYAEAIKAVDPGAKLLGPVSWGWCEYFYSAADGCGPGPDMAAHGGLPLVEWYLQRNRERELQTGVRPVDYLDLHYYPQSTNVALGDDETGAVAAMRLRSLKSLYDPTYVDESWIDQPIRLVPRMKEWIAARCPGMKIAITEYSWGGDQGISSALAQAEALAIFGREGVDLATRWVAPTAPSRVLDAFRLYLDYDGLGHGLDGESVRATSSRVDDVGSYAIRLTDTRLGLLLFNKATTMKNVQVTMSGIGAGLAPIYRFDGATPLGPAGQLQVGGGPFALDLPPRSATLLLVPLDSSAAGPSVSLPDVPWLRAEPSPFRSTTRVAYRLAGTGRTTSPVTIRICDAAGRVIRRIAGTGADPGWNAVDWDGRDGAGHAVSSGTYFLEVRAGKDAGAVKVVKVD